MQINGKEEAINYRKPFCGCLPSMQHTPTSFACRLTVAHVHAVVRTEIPIAANILHKAKYKLQQVSLQPRTKKKKKNGEKSGLAYPEKLIRMALKIYVQNILIAPRDDSLILLVDGKHLLLPTRGSHAFQIHEHNS